MARGEGSRLMVYDRTCAGRWGLPGLTASWRAGGVLYRGLGRLDAWHGVSSWTEALDWLLARSETRPIAEIQYWGHGTWGRALVARESLDVRALSPGHPWRERLAALGVDPFLRLPRRGTHLCHRSLAERAALPGGR
jgi:hypothetical protein